MTDDRLGRPVSSPVDPQRVEALVDEAVAQAAKGSYGEAASRAEQALTIDPDNAAARDLLLSYRRLAADDDERRRRRRSIAAAAATIEEMIEDGRLDEATSVTEALTMQYGQEAPVEELRARIAEARGGDLDFAEMDAAIAAIRQPDRPSSRAASPPPRLDAAGTLAAEIEDHLRSGRLEEASGRLEKLARMPGSEDRHEKLRNRIEEARQVADEHRREEEILIATAAIEERIRRGSIDEAATRLDELDARHGASAPIAELRQQIQEARALETEAVGAATPARSTERTAELLGVEDASITAPLLMTDDEPERGPFRWLAIAAVVALVAGGGGWWIYRQSTSGPATPSAASPGAVDVPAASATGGAVDAAPATSSDPAPTGDNAVAPESPIGGAGVAPNGAAPLASANQSAADRGASPATAAPAPAPADEPPVAPPASSSSSTANDAARSTAADAASTRPVEPAVESSRGAEEIPQAAEPPPPAEAAPVESAPQGSTDVVVEPLPATEQAPAAPAEAPPVEPPASDAAAPSQSAAGTQDSPAEAPAEAPRTAVAERVEESAEVPAPRVASGPQILGCGAPDVVCVKALQVPTPAYPAPARNRRLTANVVVMALVDERGRVIDTRVERSGTFRFFDDAAVDAATRSVFQPASRAGVPGRSWVRLTFKFDPR